MAYNNKKSKKRVINNNSRDDIKFWMTGGVSVQGFSHIAENIPCQDAHFIKTNGEYLFMAVADGAGSASLSDIGSKEYAKNVIENMSLKISDSSFDNDKIKAIFIESVELVSEKLITENTNLEGEGVRLSDFYSTIIIFIANANEGLFIHVGDGAGSAFQYEDISKAIISMPQNGEYINETYFINMFDWKNYIRLTPVKEKFDSIILLSDGVSPMAMTENGTKLFEPFIKPIINYVKTVSESQGESVVKQTLKKEKIRAITGDDKTFVWAIRIDE
jgi:hypothetical protein